MQKCQIIKCAVHFFKDFSQFYSDENDAVYCKIKSIFNDYCYKEEISGGIEVKFPPNIDRENVVDYKKKPAFCNQQKNIRVVFMPDRVVFLKTKQNKSDDINDIECFLKDIKPITSKLGDAYSFLGKRLSLVVETLADPESDEFKFESNICSYYNGKNIKEYAEKIVTECKIKNETFNLSTSINKVKIKIVWENEPQIRVHCVFDFNSLSENTADRFPLNETDGILLELLDKYKEISKKINS